MSANHTVELNQEARLNYIIELLSNTCHLYQDYSVHKLYWATQMCLHAEALTAFSASMLLLTLQARQLEMPFCSMLLIGC